MWDDLSAEWKTCLEAAWRIFREGSKPTFPIAAIVTDEKGTVLGIGAGHSFNGPHVRVSRNGNDLVGDHILAHAELQALLALDYENKSVKKRTCALYTTLEPCPLCIGAICMSNAISQLHYAARDPWAGSVNLFDTTTYMQGQKRRIGLHAAQDQALERVLVVLSISGNLVTGRRLDHPVTRASCQMVAGAADAAVKLNELCLLEKWRSGNAPVSDVINGIMLL